MATQDGESRIPCASFDCLRHLKMTRYILEEGISSKGHERSALLVRNRNGHPVARQIDFRTALNATRPDERITEWGEFFAVRMTRCSLSRAHVTIERNYRPTVMCALSRLALRPAIVNQGSRSRDRYHPA